MSPGGQGRQRVPAMEGASRIGASRLSIGFANVVPLVPAARVVLLIITAAGCIATVFSAAEDGFPLASTLQLVVTAAFALFAWSPIAAIIVFALAMGFSIPLGIERSVLLAVIAAAGLVSRIGSRALAIVYGVFVVASIGAVVWASNGSLPAINVLLYVIFAVVAGSLGLLMRAGATRERRLAIRIASGERRAAEIVRDERVRIASDLHDVIARDLVTVILHARALGHLDTESTRAEARDEILASAKNALAGIRQIVSAVDIEPAEGSNQPLAREIVDARRLLVAAGHSFTADAIPSDLPEHVDQALARVLREAALNAAKHGTAGRTALEVWTSGTGAGLCLRNEIAPGADAVLFPQGGRGIAGMRERARMLGGDVTTSSDGTTWTTSARMPLHRT